ncbi:MAG: phosphotransferase [Candidatus Accumulibacter sp.]|jgi:hypothetical protein|nr:phosphotransferase [Accumulibacter sp.]
MRIVTARELENWLANGETLERDTRGPKVVALKNAGGGDVYLKIFHTRRLPFLARLFPPAARFARNTGILEALNIPCPKVIKTFWINPSAGLSACLYHPLPGTTLETLLQQNPEKLKASLPRLAGFIRQIHGHGIYFRSLHIGNIVQMPDGNFGLIDVLDLKRWIFALGRRHVRRNFRHLERHLERRALNDFPLEELYRLYFK